MIAANQCDISLTESECHPTGERELVSYNTYTHMVSLYITTAESVPWLRVITKLPCLWTN